MDRLYNHLVQKHLAEYKQMIFLSGPRQVGKTTISKFTEQLTTKFLYLNWDDVEHRELIMQGASSIMAELNLAEIIDSKPIIVFDEIHKYSDWKNFLKGFYDRLAEQTHILVTGSSRLDIYKKGGDSLMGRYFPYRVHPLSVAEIINPANLQTLIMPPAELNIDVYKQLFQFGGFPDPFLKHDPQFNFRWQNLRLQQLLREDIRDVNHITDINRLELLAKMIGSQAASEMTYTSFAKKIRTSVDTIGRWVAILEAFYFCFLIRPWSKNVTRSLIKEPKIYLWDWSSINDPGAKAENFIACHLLKATHYWTDMGFGNFALYYLRDLEKREVDFIVTRNEEPWFLVEVKHGNTAGLNPSLEYFQQQTKAQHAFQVVIDKPYVNQDCFNHHSPVIVPALTFLSQLV